VTTTDDFDVRVTTTADGTTVVGVHGDLDLATAPVLEETITKVDALSRLVFDLTECGFLDSSGMRVLVGANRAAPDVRVDVVASDVGVVRALQVARLDTMFTIHSSLDDALDG